MDCPFMHPPICLGLLLRSNSMKEHSSSASIAKLMAMEFLYCQESWKDEVR